jgi:hypothetical protein
MWCADRISELTGRDVSPFASDRHVRVADVDDPSAGWPHPKLAAAARKHRDELHREFYAIVRRLVELDLLDAAAARTLDPPVSVSVRFRWAGRIYAHSSLPASEVHLELPEK